MTPLGSSRLGSSRTGLLVLALGALGVSACSASASDHPGGGAGTSSSGAGGSASAGTGGSSVTLTGGSGGSGGASTGESCDGFDDDGDGQVDEGCPCTPGATQSCSPFAKAQQGLGICSPGTQSCQGSGELGQWGACEGAVGPVDEICDDGVDDDCDGLDATCAGTGGSGGVAGSGGAAGAPSGGGSGGSGGGADVICQNISLFGDCLTVSCPSSAPYPMSCSVFFTPGDDRGCVASTPNSSVVYFQAGDQCNAGFVTGELCCTTTPQPPLTQQTCPINKPQQFHVQSSAECPAIKP